MSDTHRTPERLTTDQENELICEKLLGWQQSSWHEKSIGLVHGWEKPNFEVEQTPSFTTWAEAGLILNALAALGFSYDLSHTQTEDRTMQFGVTVWFPGKRYTVDADSQLVAIRAAALEYVRSLP